MDEIYKTVTVHVHEASTQILAVREIPRQGGIIGGLLRPAGVVAVIQVCAVDVDGVDLDVSTEDIDKAVIVYVADARTGVARNEILWQGVIGIPRPSGIVSVIEIDLVDLIQAIAEIGRASCRERV